MERGHCVDMLDAYVDGELRPEEMEEVRSHLGTCVSCARAHASILDTRRLLRESLERHRAPDVLRARVRAAVAAESRGAPPIAVQRTVRRTTTLGRAAAAVVVAALLGGAVTRSVLVRDPAPDLAGEVLASHIRSLMPGHLTDIASTNQHNVKPWFNGRVDLSPPVPRLDSAGFPLIGGRLDYVGGRPTAVVVYMRAQHVINVFWWAAHGDAAAPAATAASRTVNGYNVLRGRREGLEYWIVSDLNGAELGEFRRLLIR